MAEAIEFLTSPLIIAAGIVWVAALAVYIALSARTRLTKARDAGR